jgi:hypothetical protein
LTIITEIGNGKRPLLFGNSMLIGPDMRKECLELWPLDRRNSTSEKHSKGSEIVSMIVKEKLTMSPTLRDVN